MTEEEALQIYDYLHENYRYENGDLYTTKQRGRYKSGHKVGYFKISKDGLPCVIVALRINGHHTSFRLPILIYIYHHKICPEYIDFKDGNLTNSRIENLQPISGEQLYLRKIFTQNNKRVYELKTATRVLYYGSIQTKKGIIRTGYYLKKDEALLAHDYTRELMYEQKYSYELIKSLVAKKFIPVRKTERKFLQGVDLSSSNRFRAKIRRNGKRIELGSFKTEQEAHAAYLKAKEEHARKIQTAPFIGKIPLDKIQSAVDSVSQR